MSQTPLNELDKENRESIDRARETAIDIEGLIKFQQRQAVLKQHATEVYRCDYCTNEEESWGSMAVHLVEKHGGRVNE